MPVNLTAVWSNGQRVAECAFPLTLNPQTLNHSRLPEKDVVVTSGAYTYGLARAHKEFARMLALL